MKPKPLPFKVTCWTKLELWRADTFWTKEPGTIAWLETFGADDVLVDIGANIGLYSMYAAERCKHVYAIEPHLATVQTLIANIQANNLQNKITVLQVAMGHVSGYRHFYYNSLKAASSGSQLYQPISETGQAYEPQFVELKRVETLWRLVDDKIIESPTALKIDVDGHERHILEGANLCRLQDLRTVQVETHPQDQMAIYNTLVLAGFGNAMPHWTANGEKAISEGADPAEVTHNAVFTRAEVYAGSDWGV